MKRRWLLLLACLVAEPSRARADEVEACADAAESGQKLSLEKKHVEAKRAFIRCVQASCPTEIREVCAPLLEDASKRIAWVTVRVRDAEGHDIVDARVLEGQTEFQPRIDAVAREVSPGVYRFHATSGTLRSKDVEVAIAEGERRAVDITLELPPTAAKPTSTGPGPAPWIVGGVGLAALTTFAVLQGISQSRYSELEDTCGVTGTCDPDEVSALDAQFKASVVMLAVGGAAVVTSAVLFLTLDDATVAAQASPSSAALNATFRF
ncbi:MAG: hypothetical protein JNK04_20755 [Myxococcales bacterium]|nr:hypothetical protein [Myxococcales bacterium]